MSVYKPKGRKTWIYDFWYAGVHHKGNSFQETEHEARLVEAKKKLRLRHERGGIAEPLPAPSFTDWADTFYGHLEKLQQRTGRPKRLDRMDELIRVMLRFWGARPTDASSPVLPAQGEEAPFYNLTLQHPIDEPKWILEFDNWIDRRQVSGGTRNHYNTVMSRMYAVAMLPEYRKTTGLTMNPFVGRPRASRMTRKVALTPELVIAWLRAMSYHTRLAVSIAALAPKLRLRNVLELQRGLHIDAGVTQITMWQHKSDHITGEPLVVPISAQLRAILVDAFDRMAAGTTHVVQFHGKPIQAIRFGLAAAARDAEIPYGRFAAGGVTFHTLRHTAATILARLKVNPWIGRDAIGHRDLATTEGYTHLLIEEQRPVLEQLSAALPMQEIVTAPRRRASRIHKRRTGGALTGPVSETHEKPEEIRSHPHGAPKTIRRQFARKS